MINLQDYNQYELNFFLYFPTKDEIIYKEGKSIIRRIFEAQETYENDEQLQLDSFETYLVKQDFHKEYNQTADDVKLRILYATKFKYDKAYQALTNYLKWKRTIPITEHPEAIKFLESGAIYTFGRDHRFRPIIIVDAQQLIAKIDIDIVLLALTILFEYILSNMMLPGQIENWVIILDLGGLGITSLPQKALKQIMSYLSSNYRSRMFKCYVVRCPRTITFSWGMIKSFLEEVTVNKISFYSQQKPDPLFIHCNPNQVEIKYGGVYKEAIQQFWPPIKRHNDYLIANDDPSVIFKTKDQYFELYKQNHLALNKICQDLILGAEVQKLQISDRSEESTQKRTKSELIELKIDIELLTPPQPQLIQSNSITKEMTDVETRVQICYTSNFRVKSKSYQEPSPVLKVGDDVFSKMNEINSIEKNSNL